MLSQEIPPLQVPYKKVCEMLGVSRDTLRVLMRRDSDFPSAIKYGESRQAPVFFSYAELLEWHSKRKAQS
jgi:predicted DNA-binding transcriptional regulator AlpA